jgi:hypothetical protein
MGNVDMPTVPDSAPRTRTQPSVGAQTALSVCAWPGCALLFAPRFPGQRFHSGKCRAAYSREIGVTATTVSVRRLKTRISITLHTTDEGVLDAPIGTRYRLVREL